MYSSVVSLFAESFSGRGLHQRPLPTLLADDLRFGGARKDPRRREWTLAALDRKRKRSQSAPLPFQRAKISGTVCPFSQSDRRPRESNREKSLISASRADSIATKFRRIEWGRDNVGRGKTQRFNPSSRPPLALSSWEDKTPLCDDGESLFDRAPLSWEAQAGVAARTLPRNVGLEYRPKK